MRQTGHPLKLQDEPQRRYRIIDVATPSGLIQPIGNVTPCALLAAGGRQIAEQGANVAQRAQRRDGRDL